MKRHEEMRYAYRELATPAMFMFTLSLVVVIVGLTSVWDPMDMQEEMSGMQMVGFVSLISGFDFALCYGNGILVLYLVRFRSRFQAVVAYLIAAVILAVPCTILFYGGYSMLLGQRAPHALLVYSVSAACGLWAAALTAYALVLRLERRQARTLRRRAAAEFLASGDEQAGPATEPAAADGGAVPAAESLSTEENGSAESLLPRDSPGSAAVSGASLSRAPGVHEPGSDALHREAAAGSVKRDSSVADPEGSEAAEALNGDVVCVHVSGHYIDVVTTAGSAVLLMRLADAMSALGDRGMQVHRSYWVAFRHMRRLVRRDHRMLLCLHDGQEVPVSRPYVRPVRDRIKQLGSRSFQRGRHV